MRIEAEGDVSDVKPYNSSWTSAADREGNCVSEYECILAPQTVAAGQFKLSFKAAGKPYNWTLPTNNYEFESSIVHYLTLRVGRDFVKLDSFSTTKWEEVDRGTIETE